MPFEEAGPEISRRVRFTAPASPGRCIGATDSDLATGETVIRKGSLLTPLSAARAALSGQTEIRVYPRPSAAVLSTGSELITGHAPHTGKNLQFEPVRHLRRHHPGRVPSSSVGHGARQERCDRGENHGAPRGK